MPLDLALLLFFIGMAAGAVVVSATVLLRAHWLRQRVVNAESALRSERESKADEIHHSKLAALGQMIAGVAHEINTPLGFVKSNVEVVRELMAEYQTAAEAALDRLPPLLDDHEPLRQAVHAVRLELTENVSLFSARDLLQDSSEGINAMERLVKNLRGFARVDREGYERADINECVSETLVVAGHELGPGIEVRTEFGGLPRLLCLASELNQVFLNLVINAAQAMEGRGVLTVRTRARAGQIEIEVADDGPGIADDVLPRIFEPFFTTKPVGKGTGLGLSIADKIVSGHGGTIAVETAPGQGTSFTVRLPIDPGAAQRSKAKA